MSVNADGNPIPDPNRPCATCIHAEWVHHYDDINRDVYGCRKFHMYDDDVRFFGSCGLEGKFYEPVQIQSTMIVLPEKHDEN